MEFRAQFVHRSDEGGDVLRRRELWNAVAEIEDVTRSASEGLERLAHLFADNFRRREQHGGIEIALERGSFADPAARVRQVHGPVQTDAVASGPGDALEPGRTALGKDDDGNA